MTDRTTKTRNTDADFFGKTDSEFTSGQNAPDDGEDIEYAGLDDELKSIFDNLRLVGNAQDYSLDEVLAKAILREENLPENKVKIPVAASAFRPAARKKAKSGIGRIFKVREVEFQFQVMSMLLLFLASIGTVFVFTSTGQEVAKQFREIQVQAQVNPK